MLPWEMGREFILARRLSWLLFFRLAVASLLLLFALAADYFDWSLSRVTFILYVVSTASYAMVLVEGLLLRAQASPTVLSTVHLATAVGIALAVVQGTGAVNSAFSYLYLLAILDGAIIAGRRIALMMASICSITYGTQLVLQLYRVFPGGEESTPTSQEFVSAIVVHLGAFYLIAILAGHLAGLLETAREVATSAKFDLSRVLEVHSAVLESLPLGVVTVDANGLVNTANQAASWILDIPVEHLIGASAPKMLHDFLKGNQLFTTLSIEHENRIRQISLSRSHVQRSLTQTALYPELQLTLLVMEDRTKWYAMEHHLREKERLAGIGELAAAMAHEIRNPLASISGSLELLDKSESITSAQRDRLNHIVSREVAQLNRLLDNFLVYARPAPPNRIRVDVALIVREVAESVAQAREYTDNKLVIKSKSPLYATIDPDQIRQILWNLLKNAFEATPPNHVIELRAKSIKNKNSESIVLEVADSGSGIDVEIRNRIFEPFQTTKSSGSGLGLSIVHRIIDNHRGTISVGESKFGGALFSVVLPAQDNIME